MAGHASIGGHVPTIGSPGQKGPRGLQGHIGLPGTAPWTKVRDLEADPDAVTDWGEVINDALSDGIKSFYFGEGYDFPFTTPIDLSGTYSVRFLGDNGTAWVRDGKSTNSTASRLIYKGSGDDPAIDVSGAVAPYISDLGLWYDNTAGSFTGAYIGHEPYVAQSPLALACWRMTVERCQGGFVGRDGTRTAKAILGWSQGVCHVARDCAFGDAEWGILGVELPHTDAFSNAHLIENCYFGNCSSAGIGNVYENWIIERPVFEFDDDGGYMPAGISADPAYTNLTSKFVVNGAWAGDDPNAIGSPAPPTVICFNQPANSTWHFTLRDSQIGQLAGPVGKFLGQGTIRIEDNHGLDVSTGPLFDLGDASALLDIGGDTAPIKNLVKITGNRGNALASESVSNRLGHRGVNIYDNAPGLNMLEQRTIDGHFSAGWTQGSPSGAIVGTSVTEVSVKGTDSHGWILIRNDATPEAGVLAEITFAEEYEPSAAGGPGSTQKQPIVLLQPLDLGNLASEATADLGYYVQQEFAELDKFRIAVNTAPAANANLVFAYWVVGL